MANIVITINAVNNAGPVLTAIGKAATQAGQQMQKAGQQGQQGMQNMAKGARQADTELRTFERTSLAVGAAMGALALGISKAGAAYQNQERQLAAISRMYGEAAEGAIEYAEKIQDTTRFSNDAARDSFVLLNTMVSNYGLAQNQIETLVSRSADLAAMHGKSLTEVSQMVSNALRGEGEYIEQIGVTMNQTFIAAEAASRGMKNFISEMSAAEQAAFRYTVLLEQTATAQGYAMETATGTRGAIALVSNEFQDAAQAMGGFLGPVGEVAAQFSSYALWLPLIASQIGRVSSLLINSARQFQAFNNATATLGKFAGPIGIGVTAVSLALTALGLKWASEKQAQAQAAAQAEQTADSYQALYDAISNAYLSGHTETANFVKDQSMLLDTWIGDWNNAVDQTAKGMEQGDKFDWMPNFIENLSRGVVIAGEEIGALFGADTPMGDAMRDGTQEAFIEAFKIPETEVTQINNEMQRVLSLAMTPGADKQKFQADWSEFLISLYGDLATEKIMPNEISEEIAKWRSDYAQEMAATISEIERSKTDLEHAFEMDDLRTKGWSESQIDLIEDFDKATTAIDDYTAAWVEASSQIGIVAGAPLVNESDISNLGLTTEQIELKTMAMERLRTIMLSGDWDNAAIVQQMEIINDLFLSDKITGEQYTQMLIDLSTKGYREVGTSAEEAAGKMRLASEAMAEQATSVADLTGSMIAGATAAAQYAAAQGAAQEKFAASARDAIRGRIEDMRELEAAQKEFIAGYMESTGMDTPLSQVNLTSLRSDASALAGDFALATSQLDNMYRAIVGNTDAIQQQADTILQWATDLINVRGELGRIDDLISQGLINGDQYAAAQDAYDSIAISTAQITDNLDAVQAIQAPIIAQSLEWQAQMTETLLGQDAATQRVTLGWMDATSAAQAFQLVQQLTLMQSGELGAVSEATMNTIVQGAVMANPLLFDMLTSMGVISGTPVDFEINTDALAGADSELQKLTTSLNALVTTLREMYHLPALEIEVEGEEKISSVMEQINAWGGIGTDPVELEVVPTLAMGHDFTGMYAPEPVDLPVTPVVDQSAGAPTMDPIEVQAIPVFSGGGGDPTGAYGGGTASIPPVEVPATLNFGDEPMASIPEPEPIEVPVSLVVDEGSSSLTDAVATWQSTVITGPMFQFTQDSSQVSAAAGVWTAAIFTGPTFQFYPDATAVNILAGSVSGTSYSGPTFNFVADDSDVQSVIARYANGAVIATQYVNIVARNMGGSGVLNERHGGPLHFLTGGVVPFIAAENNQPEIAHFRNGGSALLDREGMYFAPPMTMISPSNTVRGSSVGGETFVFNINVEGSVHREADFKASLMSEITRTVKKRNAAIGV